MGRFKSASSLLLVAALAVMSMGCGETTTGEAAGDEPVTVKAFEDLPNCSVGKYAIVYYVQEDPGSGYYFCDGWNYHLLDLSGLDGISVLVETEPIEATGQPPCPNGGTVLRVGPDAAPYDGIMDSVSTHTICNGLDGADGQSCTVEDFEDHAIITCEDGTSATINDGNDCTVINNGDGTSTIQCDDGSSVTVIDPCSVDNGGCGPVELFECGITLQVVNQQAITGVACDLADLSGADLSGLDLSGLNLSGANLSGANLTDTQLVGTNLYGADLSDAVLVRANLYSANVGNANFYSADLSEADLDYVSFSTAVVIGTNFSNASMYRASLYNRNASGANFSGAYLAYADLRYTRLDDANLSGANLYNADLYRASAVGADLSGATLYGARLRYADFSNADLRDAVLLATSYWNYAQFYYALYNSGTQFPPGFSTSRWSMTYVGECGNGVVEPGEQCDDGNTQDGDGCQADCTLPPPVCGNGIQEWSEECDDGNTEDGDGCNSDCTFDCATWSGVSGAGGVTRVVAIGKGGFEYFNSADAVNASGLGDDVQFLVNALTWLGDGHSTVGNYQILYSNDCDPRTDPEMCRVTSDLAVLQPFYDGINTIGTITYAPAGDVPDLGIYSVVMVDDCKFPDIVDRCAIEHFLRNGGRVVIGDAASCSGGYGTNRTELGTELLAPFGVTYTELDPIHYDYLYIPIEEQTAFFEGVAELFRWRWTPMILDVTSPLMPLVESTDGIIAAYGEVDTSTLP